VGEYQRGGCFGGETREIDAIPGWGGGGEDAGRWTQRGRGVVPYTEAIAVVGSAVILEEETFGWLDVILRRLEGHVPDAVESRTTE